MLCVAEFKNVVYDHEDTVKVDIKNMYSVEMFRLTISNMLVDKRSRFVFLSPCVGFPTEMFRDHCFLIMFRKK